MDAPEAVAVAPASSRDFSYPRSGAMERILDLVFPPSCVGCGRIGRWVCDRCWHQFVWRADRTCDFCGTPWISSPCVTCVGRPSSLDGIVAACDFNDVSRATVHALKYHGHHAISGMMGTVMGEAARGVSVSLVAPVSLHLSRRRERGYDQAAMLARRVARRLDLPFSDDVLKRTRRTKQQVTLDHAFRAENVAGAFQASPLAEGATILLVDDVLTTGATMEAAAGALRAAGAAVVIGLVFAHAIRDDPPA